MDPALQSALGLSEKLTEALKKGCSNNRGFGTAP